MLEVVLALGLLVLTAGLLTGAMRMVVPAVEGIRLDMEAEDLAVTVVSEVSAGLRPMTSAGPEAFEQPWEQWTWSVQVEPMTDDAALADRLNVVTVRVEHAEREKVYELRQMMGRDAGDGGLW